MANRDLAFVLAALLPLSTGCADSTQPVSPAPYEDPAPQPSPPPASPGPPAPPGSAGPDHIYLANVDGSGLTRLTPGSRPAWAPDGRRIAFDRGGAVHVIDADGSTDVRLAAGVAPAWSPDGTQIAFTNSDGIGVTGVDGSAGKTLIRHNFRDDTHGPSDMGVGKPAWSPDGTRIAFEHLGDGEFEPAQAFVMGADGLNPRRLTSLPNRSRYAESDPSWSPDGSRIVYWSYGFGIAAIDSRGGVPNALYAAFPSVAYGAKPAWSPDGRTIVFNRDRHAATSAIWIMSATGTGARVLIPGGYDAAWSPNGKRIAFVSAR